MIIKQYVFQLGSEILIKIVLTSRQRGKIMEYKAGKKVFSISQKKVSEIVSDNQMVAKEVQLKYVQCTDNGISRHKSGKGFVYYNNQVRVTDLKTLSRIKSLVLPPAWKDVWICKHENGHLQATGVDAKGRKQYRYHPKWNELRKEKKFLRLYQFGKKLTNVRKHIAADLRKHKLSKRKVLALVVSVMDATSIRIGNEQYEKRNGSYGLSTMKDRHVSFKSGKLKFTFVGKKAVKHEIPLTNKRLAKLVKQCRDIPGKELFQYYDEQGEHHAIDSGDVNAYIHEIAGEEFSSKDFRTWRGTVRCLQELAEAKDFDTKKDKKAYLVRAIDAVAKCLGNTRSVCKSHYIHPRLIQDFENGELSLKIKKAMKSIKALDNSSDYEKLLLKIIN